MPPSIDKKSPKLSHLNFRAKNILFEAKTTEMSKKSLQIFHLFVFLRQQTSEKNVFSQCKKKSPKLSHLNFRAKNYPIGINSAKIGKIQIALLLKVKIKVDETFLLFKPL